MSGKCARLEMENTTSTASHTLANILRHDSKYQISFMSHRKCKGRESQCTRRSTICLSLNKQQLKTLKEYQSKINLGWINCRSIWKDEHSGSSEFGGLSESSQCHAGFRVALELTIMWCPAALLHRSGAQVFVFWCRAGVSVLVLYHRSDH